MTTGRHLIRPRDLEQGVTLCGCVLTQVPIGVWFPRSKATSAQNAPSVAFGLRACSKQGRGCDKLGCAPSVILSKVEIIRADPEAVIPHQRTDQIQQTG